MLLVGCRPHNILSPDKMEAVLYDLHQTEGILHVTGYERGHDSVIHLTYDAVLARHGVTRAEFDSSLVWYTNNPQYFDKFYPRIIDRLENRRTEERERRENKTEAITDSLRIVPVQLRVP